MFKKHTLYTSTRSATMFNNEYYAEGVSKVGRKKFFFADNVDGNTAEGSLIVGGKVVSTKHLRIEFGLFKEATDEDIQELPKAFIDGLCHESRQALLGKKSGDSSIGDAIEANESLKKLSEEIKANLRACAADVLKATVENGTFEKEFDKILAPAIKKAAEEITATKVVVKRRDDTEVDFDSCHEVFPAVLKRASVGLNVMLVGRAGTGKTAIAYQVAEALGLPFSSVSCTAGMGEAELRGRLLPVTGGGWEYMTSDFVNIYENGGVFLFDEIDAADSNTLLFINQALANGRFNLDIRRENTLVKRHKDFICIAAANTFGNGGTFEYAGREKLDESTLDRFRAGVIEVGYDAKLERNLVHRKLLTWAEATRKKLDSNQIRRPLSTRFLIDCTKAIHAGVLTVDEAIKTFYIGLTEKQIKAIGG